MRATPSRESRNRARGTVAIARKWGGPPEELAALWNAPAAANGRPAIDVVIVAAALCVCVCICVQSALLCAVHRFCCYAVDGIEK